MSAYLTTMFWLGVVSLVMRSFWLIGEHPRIMKTNIGSDVLGWLVKAALLAWVGYLKYWT